MEAAYNELLEIDITTTPPIHINTPKKVKSPAATKIQKVRKSGFSGSEIVEYLQDTDGLTKLVTPKSKDQETRAKLNRQDLIFTATPPPIKRLLQPDSSEMTKPQKQFKRSIETEKINNEERIPIKENKESSRSNDKIATDSVTNKFQQKIKNKNAKELIQKFPTKGYLRNEYLKGHFKDNEPAIIEINKNQNYIILAPSNIHCFNKIMKDWPEYIIKEDQLEVFEKDLRPMLCVNKIPQNIEIETVKNIIINRGLHPENIRRLVIKNGDPTTVVLFKLKNEGEEQHAKRFGIKTDNKIKYMREYVNKEKLIIRCFKCNKFGHLSNSCKNNNSLCPRCGSNKQKCKGNCPKQHWNCVNCLGNHSAAWEGCKKYKEKLKEVTQAINVTSYAEAVKSDMSYMIERIKSESSYIKNNFLKINQFIDILTNIIENIDKFALYKELSRLKDKISTITLKFCNLQKNNRF